MATPCTVCAMHTESCKLLWLTATKACMSKYKMLSKALKSANGMCLCLQENEPLHIFISSPVQKAFADAVKLAQSLLDTIKDEHAKQFPHAPLSAPPYSGGGVPPPAAGVPAGYSQPPYSGYGAAPGYGPPASGYPPPHMYPPGNLLSSSHQDVPAWLMCPNTCCWRH